jgi:hypothetical protein
MRSQPAPARTLVDERKQVETTQPGNFQLPGEKYPQALRSSTLPLPGSLPVLSQLYREPAPHISLPLSIVFFRLTRSVPLPPRLANWVYARDTSAWRAFELRPHATFDLVTRPRPPTEDKIASPKPYEDLEMSAGRRESELVSRTISVGGVGGNPVGVLT